MRLSQVVAQGGVPGVQVANAGRGEALVAQTLSQVSDYAFDVLERRQRVQGATEAANLLAEMELGLTQIDEGLKTTTTDPDEYLTKRAELVGKLRGQITERARMPAAQQALALKLPGLLADREQQAVKFSNRLFVDGQEAAVNSTLDYRAKLAGQALTADDLQRQYVEGLRAIVGVAPDGDLKDSRQWANAPLFGRAKLQEKVTAWRDRVFGEAADRTVNQDPDGFLAEIAKPGGGMYHELDPAKRNAYIARAQEKSAALARERNRSWEAFHKRLEEEAESERKVAVTDLRSQALKGSLSIAQLDDAKAMRQVDAAEYEHLYKLATAPNRRPSDEATLQDARLRARRQFPTISEAELRRLNVAGKLNDKDTDELLSFVISRGEDLKGEVDTQLTGRQSQAEQRLRETFGIITPFSQLDPLEQKLLNTASAELTARSKRFGGPDDPLDAVNDIIKRYKPMIDSTAQLKASQIRETLMPQARPAAGEDVHAAAGKLEAWWRALTPAQQTMQRGVYEAEQRKLLDLQRAEDREKAATAPEKPAGGKTK